MNKIIFLIAILVFVLLCLKVLGSHKNIRQRLSIRIAVLILLTGPAVLITLLMFNAVYAGALGAPAPLWSRIIQLALLAIGTPLLLGLLAARYVTRPLGEFTRAINSIKENNYQVRLKDSGIHEFDRVFGELNELLGRLLEEETLRKNLISDTSHELNTPIMALVGQLEGMKKGIIKKDSEHIDTLLQQTYRLNETSQRLMEYARIQSQTLRPALELVDLGKLVDALRREQDQALEQSHMKLHRELPLPTIQADKTLLKQLLTNLIQNATRYSEGSNITIAFDGKRLTIADDGHGIPEENIRHIFERFYRVDDSRNRATGGLGLGLAIVKEISDSHGWHIEAKNTHPGLIYTIDLDFTPHSHRPVLVETMKAKTTPILTASPRKFQELSSWIAIAAISVGILLFAYTAIQQNYRQSANDPQLQMAQDIASAWNAGAAPKTLVSPRQIDAATSLSPFTILVDKNDQVLASDVQLNGATPLPPVFNDLGKTGELRFSWQPEGGYRFATVIEPTSKGYVITARSLKEIEQREQQLALMAAVTLFGIIGVLVLTYVMMR